MATTSRQITQHEPHEIAEEDGAETERRDEGGRGEEETGVGIFFCALKREAVEWTWRGGEGGVGGYHKNQVA